MLRAQRHHRGGIMSLRLLRAACVAVALLAFAPRAGSQTRTDEAVGAELAAAQSRGRLELNCQDVSAQLLSSKIIDPAPFQGGMWRGEYTIGVRGCNRQIVYMTICLDSNDCNAIADSANMAPLAP